MALLLSHAAGLYKSLLDSCLFYFIKTTTRSHSTIKKNKTSIVDLQTSQISPIPQPQTSQCLAVVTLPALAALAGVPQVTVLAV